MWLYGRASSVSREITIVDSKNKKTPQAIERIFWIQGLKLATKATNAIVATNNRRQAIKDYGKEMGVPVLDELFLGKLKKFEDASRLTEEEYFKKIDDYAFSKTDGDWHGRMQMCKSLLAKGLSFDSCNEWLINVRFFAEQVITKPNQREVAPRSLYLIFSYIAVTVDYILREFSFLE